MNRGREEIKAGQRPSPGTFQHLTVGSREWSQHRRRRRSGWGGQRTTGSVAAWKQRERETEDRKVSLMLSTAGL